MFHTRIYTYFRERLDRFAVDDSSVNTMFLRCGGSLIKASARSMMYDAEEEHSDTAGRSARPFFRRPFPDAEPTSIKTRSKTCRASYSPLGGMKFVRHSNNVCPSCGSHSIDRVQRLHRPECSHPSINYRLPERKELYKCECRN